MGGNAQIGSGGDMNNMPNGGQMGNQQVDGGADHANLLAQQQALMAMTGGNPGGGFDAGASREALMNLLTRGGGAGMGAAGMMGQIGGMQMGMPQQGFGGMGGFQGQEGFQGGQDQNSSSMMGMGAFGGNPAFGGFSPAMGMMGMSPAMMAGGMSTLGSSNLLGAAPGSGQGGAGESKGMGDGSNPGDAPQSNPMAQQMLLQQMLQQQALGGFNNYGQMPQMMGGDAGAANANPYMSMLGQGGQAAGDQGRQASEAGVFQSGAMPDFSKAGKKARPKKPKNKPKRPLSAYNIFFKDERAKILAGIPDKKGEDGEDDDEGNENDDKKNGDGSGEEGDKDGDGKNDNGSDGGDGDSKNDDSKKVSGKKRKRVPHGKIGFESLAKIVGQRWKELPPEELDVYKKRAEEDMKRYRKEMEAYVQKQREGLEQSREHLEKLVDEETKKRYFGDGGGV